MSLSVGIIKFPTEWKNKIHVPNHQPVMLSRLFHILLDKWLLYRNSKMTKRKIRKIQFWKTYSSGDSLFGWVSQQLDKAKKKSVNWVQFCLLLERKSNKIQQVYRSTRICHAHPINRNPSHLPSWSPFRQIFSFRLATSIGCNTLGIGPAAQHLLHAGAQELPTPRRPGMWSQRWEKSPQKNR